MRSIGVLIFLVLFSNAARPQLYPRWFLEQGSLECGLTAVGYSNKGFYEDSSASQTSRNARQNLARQRMTTVEGGQAFWATEAGTAWMGSDLRMSVDSAALKRAAADTGAAEVYIGAEMVISLVVSGNCAIPDSMKKLVPMGIEQPAWIHGTPSTNSCIFSLGVAPAYFYETSSWESAERMAIVGLAKEAGDSLIAMEKNVTGSGQAILNEQVSVVLRDFGVVARWFDARERIYYVLAAVDRKNIGRVAGEP